jgi:hypothetical protein
MPSGFPRGIEDDVADRLPGLLGERSRRRGVCGNGVNRPPAILGGAVDVAAHLVLGALELRHDRFALDQEAAAIVVQCGRQFGEGIRLVHELREQDLERHRLKLP